MTTNAIALGAIWSAKSRRDNAKKNGRGGKAAAAKKFGVNINSVLNWMSSSKGPKKTRAKKTSPAPRQKRSTAKSTSGAAGSEVEMLEKLLQIRKQINGLEAEYAAIKSRL